jgi:hypothetical protein
MQALKLGLMMDEVTSLSEFMAINIGLIGLLGCSQMGIGPPMRSTILTALRAIIVCAI